MDVIDPRKFGVSFSIKQCRAFGIDPQKTLDWLIKDAASAASGEWWCWRLTKHHDPSVWVAVKHGSSKN